MFSLLRSPISLKSRFISTAGVAAAFFLFYAATAGAGTLTVAVGYNVKSAFTELQQAFSKSSGIEVKSVVGPSGKIAAQIKSGAPFDVFLSDDMAYPTSLYQDGVAVASPQIYAKGALVLRTAMPFGLRRGIQVLSDPAVKKIALANPDLEPYGREAVNALKNLRLYAAVKPKLVYSESMAQVNQFIDLKSVDVGFSAKSDALDSAGGVHATWVELPKGSYQPIAQGVVILRFGSVTNPKAARSFVEFLSSPTARGILQRHGYIIP